MAILDYTVYISEQRLLHRDRFETPGLKGTYICFEISDIYSTPNWPNNSQLKPK